MDGRSMIRPRSYFLGAAALMLAGMVLGLGLSAGLNLQKTSRAADAQLASVSRAPAIVAPPESPFTAVVEKALPAVVFIDVRKKESQSSDPNDEFMKRFFGDQMPRRQQRVPSSGSGFIISSDGHIMTNNHVVRDADLVGVQTSRGQRIEEHRGVRQWLVKLVTDSPSRVLLPHAPCINQTIPAGPDHEQ